MNPLRESETSQTSDAVAGLDPNGSAFVWAKVRTREHLDSFVGSTLVIGGVAAIVATVIGSPGSGASKVLFAVLVFLFSVAVAAVLIFAWALVSAPRQQRNALRGLLKISVTEAEDAAARAAEALAAASVPTELTERQIRDGLGALYREAQEVGSHEPTGVEWDEDPEGRPFAYPVGVSEAESDEWVAEVEAWRGKAEDWIATNMSQADAAIFLDFRDDWWPDFEAANDGRTTRMVIVARHSLQHYLTNLMRMMNP